MSIDYKNLLWKYMHHVDDMEGTTFVHDAREPYFSAEEEKVLHEIKNMTPPDWGKMRDSEITSSSS